MKSFQCHVNARTYHINGEVWGAYKTTYFEKRKSLRCNNTEPVCNVIDVSYKVTMYNTDTRLYDM